jgi:hypothetical protein
MGVAVAWLNDKELLAFLVNLIGYASIVSAAVFGMIGLFAEYKVDGKTTVWGKVAAVGIALSAAFGLTSTVLQRRAEAAQHEDDRLAAEKERKDAQQKYDSQIAQLLRLNAQVTGVNQTSSALMQRMGASLLAQQRTLSAQRLLLTSARQAMTLTSGLTAQERENTGRVLKSLWDDTNRIDGARIEIVASATCETDDGERGELLFDNGMATVSLFTDEEAEQDARGEFTGWERLSVLERSLYSFQQASARLGPELGAVTRFHSFISWGPDLTSNPELWRTSHGQITIIAPVSPELRRIAAAAVAEAPAQSRPTSSPSPISRGSLQVVPCEASAAVVANGRMVMEAEAPVKIARDADGVETLQVEFPLQEIEDDRLPVFAEVASPAADR